MNGQPFFSRQDSMKDSTNGSYDPELVPLPCHLPTREYLKDLEQLLKLSIDDQAYHTNRNAQKHAEFRKAQDLKKYGKKQAFASIKEPGTQLIHQVLKKIEVEVLPQGDYSYGLLTVRSEHMPHFDLATVVKAAGQTMQIVQRSETHLELIMEDPEVQLPLYFQQLRTAIAQALLGQHSNIQPHIANMALVAGIVDPEFYVLKEAIKHARKFFDQATQEQEHLFYTIAKRPPKKIQHAVGPASAFAVYLAKLAWSIDNQGNLHTFAFHNLHLKTSNLEDILHAAEYAWMQHVSVQASNRKDMQHLPVIDRRATHREFAKQPEDFQITLGLQITNGVMFAHQKNKFAEQVEPVCELCQQPDSHRHQMLECDATAMVRHNHQETCDKLNEMDPVHLAVPTIYHDSHFEFHTVLQHSLPEAEPTMPPFQEDKIYTDASCLSPTAPNGRLVTYSMVVLRRPLPDWLRHQHPEPIHLDQVCRTLGAAHVTGTQTIPRGELFAAVKVHGLRTGSTVVTDSSYVVKCHWLIQNEPVLSRLQARKNFDLLSRLHRLYHEEHIPLPVQKIKAHQDWPEFTDSSFLDIPGNWAADQVAKQAQAQHAPPLTQQFSQLAREAADAASLLRSQYELRRQLSAARVRLLAPEIQANPDVKYQQLVDWEVADPWTLFDLPDHEVIHGSPPCAAGDPNSALAASAALARWEGSGSHQGAAEPGSGPAMLVGGTPMKNRSLRG
eukprot:Skav213729  [mRNA]  locus=scaffold2563:254008:258295:- [translate_table: standard]